MYCNYHELVDIGKKTDFCALQIAEHATNRAFSIQHACCLPAAPTPYADVTQLRILDLDAGKGHQVMKCIHSVTVRCGVLQY